MRDTRIFPRFVSMQTAGLRSLAMLATRAQRIDTGLLKVGESAFHLRILWRSYREVEREKGPVKRPARFIDCPCRPGSEVHCTPVRFWLKEHQSRFVP
jgi:hypothetical protein